MTWTSHWSVLLTGAAASLISLIGLFAGFWLTTRHDRAQERRRNDAERAAQQQAERAAAVARVYTALTMQPKDLTFAPIYGNAQALELLSACVHLHAVIARQHPDVASWVLVQHSQLLRAREKYRRVCALPMVRKKPAQDWGHALGAFAGPFVDWQAGRRSEAWSGPHLSLYGGDKGPADPTSQVLAPRAHSCGSRIADRNVEDQRHNARRTAILDGLAPRAGSLLQTNAMRPAMAGERTQPRSPHAVSIDFITLASASPSRRLRASCRVRRRRCGRVGHARIRHR